LCRNYRGYIIGLLLRILRFDLPRGAAKLARLRDSRDIRRLRS
jgi:hypothetical protein